MSASPFSEPLFAGIDIGSTTIKLVLLNGREPVYGEYRRHHADIAAALSALLQDARETVGNAVLLPRVTGSGSISLAKKLGIGFVQEVAAEAVALRTLAPQTDVAIELGGEDAKILYLTGGLEERMNGVCAGGTGSFIDQMAALLKTDAPGLDALAAGYTQLYPIAARCGVFAKSDIQPLINDGARREDLAASVFQAVVNQTISGLACGKPIRGNVAFLGGPLHFLPQLRQAFIRTLKLTPAQIYAPDNAHLFPATGAALSKEPVEPVTLSELLDRLQKAGDMPFELHRLPPLFESEADYAAFTARHSAHRVSRRPLESYAGDCFLGIDAGSTTTKLALIAEDGSLLWSFYANNDGSPIKTAVRAMGELAALMPASAHIRRACSTGYGETLLKTAFCLDDGEVETVAHCTAAAFFDPETDCVLDIGGQDMKFIRLKRGAVDSVLLNEACSSGCGSFIENFAVSLGYTAPSFAEQALFAPHPLDLGTRCTVFMNSNVKQAQKEGATVADISAGLAYSVVKNALFKVIKLTDASSLGRHILVQGGTFCNHAVLRALEKTAGAEVICPDIAGLMGAFGAALIARQRCGECEDSTLLPFDRIAALTYTTTVTRCKGCQNSCLLTVNRFPDGRRHISGNRCERGAGKEPAQTEAVPNLPAYKYQRIFDYTPLPAEKAPRGVIGIPRALNLYENYPFWVTLFAALGFSVVLSPKSSRRIYERGMESIPSESECYPAKLAHGHIQSLIDAGIHTIFYPSVFFERPEPGAQNKYNCPMVIGSPENIRNNVEDLSAQNVRFIHPFLSFGDEKAAEDRLCTVFAEEWQIPADEVRTACRKAWAEQLRSKADIRAEGKRALDWMEAHGRRGIVLCGRPYHADPEIHHGIPEMIASYGFAVLTEDSLPVSDSPERPLRVTDQWSYHSRLYTAAQFVRSRRDLELIQLNSFGCGLDAVTTDQVAEILEPSNKLYTLLKIDEISNLGAARIRVRSLIAAIRQREERGVVPAPVPSAYSRAVFTRKMKREGYTILAPQMLPIHFEMVQTVFRRKGYRVEILGNDTRAAVDAGLRCVNNDACYPSLIVTGQILDAVRSGRYDTHRLAIIMSQTGGCCRATNYIAFIRRALDQAGYGYIPVISLSLSKLEKNPGFSITPGLLYRGAMAVVLGDVLMQCLYRTRPYEAEPGAADALCRQHLDRCKAALDGKVFTVSRYRQLCRDIVADFDVLPLRDVQKPRVGIVGEILVKYMPLANNHLVELLEAEGAEAVVPDLLDFFAYCFYGNLFRSDVLGVPRRAARLSAAGIRLLDLLRRPATRALEQSRRFTPAQSIYKTAELAKPYLSVGNQYGEGWFLTGEMVHLIHSGVNRIVCIQPFGCLPNHIVGKGVIKAVRRNHPTARIAAVDYDPGASEVNQLNRIKLLLSDE